MSKKTSSFSVVVLFSALAFLAAPLLKASSGAAELTEELLCDNDVSSCYSLFEINLLAANLLCRVQDDKALLEEIVSYIAQHEKSPPIPVT